MGLYERIMKEEEPSISMHGFASAMGELSRSAISKANIVSKLGLDATAESELDALITASPALDLLTDVLILAEEGYYTKAQVKTRLGI